MQRDESAIAVKNLFFGYQGQPVLHDVSFEVPCGRLTVLLGRNGSGKSTLLKLIAGMVPLKHGQITILGQDGRTMSREQRARMLGYLPQFHAPVFPFKVEDVVLTGRASYIAFQPSDRDREKAREAMQTVGIGDLHARPYNELSGGERQLVMIARVLAQQPRIVLLDEPVSALDLANQNRLLHLIGDLTKAGITALAVFHDPNTAIQYGDHAIFLKEGCIQESSERSNPWDISLLSRVYDIRLERVPFRGKTLVYPEMP